MNKLLTTLLISLTLQACGSAPVSAQPSQPASVLSIPGTGGADDGYGKGLQALRDVRNAAGGTRGNVNTSLWAYTITGEKEVSFEWTTLSVLDNYSLAGENTANYAQCNAFSTGPCFAGVSEVADTTGKSNALIAHEFDVWATGPDNGGRVGIDVLSGDARAIRGLGRSTQADASIGVRIGQTTASPWATWDTGLQIQGNLRSSAIKILAPNGTVVFEIKPNGDIYRRGVLIP